MVGEGGGGEMEGGGGQLYSQSLLVVNTNRYAEKLRLEEPGVDKIIYSYLSKPQNMLLILKGTVA